MLNQPGQVFFSRPFPINNSPMDLVTANTILRHPLYYLTYGQDDRVQCIYSWSVCPSGEPRSYICRIYLDSDGRWMVVLHGTIHHNHHLVSSGDCYFYMFDVNRRLLLRLVLPDNVVKLVELYVDFEVALKEICHKNNLGYGGSCPRSPIQPTNAPSLGHFDFEPMQSLAATLTTQSHLAFFSESAVIPDVPPLDTFYREDLEARSTPAATPDEGTFISQWLLGDPNASKSDFDSARTVLMKVPEQIKTQDEAMKFVREFVGGLSKGVRRPRVTCSMCRGCKRSKRWEARPSNLERHLLAHLGIKCFSCKGCDKRFTTNDQLKRHSQKCHLNLAEFEPGPST
ncbi:hypothetical protein B0J17DRAFT_671571 [Rhizoctonia solani]|nr:hypothetical protein B0J17DRAFT_671571 [Rhizoctonia solani]